MEMTSANHLNNGSNFESASSSKISWQLKDIVLGIFLFLIINVTVFHILPKINAFRYRPWLAIHVAFIVQVVSLGFLFAYSFYICRKRGFRLLAPFLELSSIVKEAFKGLLYALLIVFVSGAVAWSTEILFEIKRNSYSVTQWAQNDPNSYFVIVTLFMAVTAGPIAEEYFFRGFLFNALKSFVPLWLAMCVQALLFSAFHNYDFIGSLSVFLTGIGLAIIYEHKEDLLSPIIVHSICNAFWVLPLLLLTLQNYHSPSHSWDEARTNPSWMTQTSMKRIDLKSNGLEQVRYAINTWGSKGSNQWKQEAIAFKAVLSNFPKDRIACAKALSGITEIYAYPLRDYRRAIIEANKVQSLYADQREQVSHALLKEAYAYLMLKNFDNARKAYQRILEEFNDFDDDRKSALRGIEQVDYLMK